MMKCSTTSYAEVDHPTSTIPLVFDLGDKVTATIEGQRLSIFVTGPALDMRVPAKELQQHLMSCGVSEWKAERMVDKVFGKLSLDLAFSVLKKSRR